jgi:hypothetical protein
LLVHAETIFFDPEDGKPGVGNKVLDFYDDPDKTLPGISQQIKKDSSKIY